jgi:hypothetical protein
MTSSLLRRLTAVLAAAVLMITGVPALAHAAGPHHPRPPHAAPAPDRIAYVQRASTTTSSVPQRTTTI